MTRRILGRILLVALITGAFVMPQGSSALNLDEPDDPTLVDGEVVALFTGGLPADLETFVVSMNGEIVARDDLLNMVAVAVDDEADAISRFEARSDVRVAHQARWLAAQGHVSPNDPRVAEQWGISAVNLTGAWHVTTGDRNVRVAVVDSGARGTHEDLTDNLCGPHLYPFGQDGPEDYDGHGTHVTGIVAANMNNGKGIAGTAQVCVMVAQQSEPAVWGGRDYGYQLRQFTCDALTGSTDCVLTKDYSEAESIAWAANNSADVISMSFGGLYLSDTHAWAIQYAYEQGVLLVAAAGNNRGCASDGSTVLYPASDWRVIAVAALAPPTGDTRWDGSNCGPEVEISAAGAHVMSTTVDGGYGNMSGTSMATPQVSGVAALVKSGNVTLDAPTIRCILVNTAVDLGEPGRDHEFGWGRMDAGAAVTAAADPATVGC